MTDRPVPERLPVPEQELDLRTRAVESLLVEKRLISTDAIDRVVQAYEQDIGPMLGAGVVAKAWSDPAFKKLLLEDATQACNSLGISGLRGEYLKAVESTSDEHHVVVCTLCSCYPWAVLGLPPTWYKQPAYRSQIVKQPRRVLREDFGLELDEDVRITVWDSSSEARYFVVPERPPGTDKMTEAELTELVTRDSMIGVAKVMAP